MPSISSLFYSTDTEKQTLHKRIVPSVEQRVIQQKRWRDLEEYLKNDLKEMTDYTIHSWIQGSYKFGTQIRPCNPTDEFDIDLGIYFDWPGENSDGKYGAKKLKSIVQESVKKYAKQAEEEVKEVVNPPKTRCSRIRFSGGFHIDIPSYHLDLGRDYRSLATEKDEWEDSDPKALYLWFREQCSENENNLIRRLIRYIKMWSALSFEEQEKPSTIILTVLVAQAFIDLTDDEKKEDDTALKKCLEIIVERLKKDTEVLNPVDINEDLNRLDSSVFENFINRINDLIDIAERALDSSTELDAATIWQEAFLHFFPLPISHDIEPTKNALTTVAFVPEVVVEAYKYDDASKTIVAKGKNSITNVPKKCIINFKLTNTSSLPPDAYIQWFVRNEGKEADFVNDLGHIAGNEITAKETSAYKGTHFMDVIIKSSLGVILGYRRIPVTISGTFTIPRNKKKPWSGRPSKSQLDSKILKILQK